MVKNLNENVHSTEANQISVVHVNVYQCDVGALYQALALMEGQLPDGEEPEDKEYQQRRRRRSSAWGATHRSQSPNITSNTISPIDTPRSLVDEDEEEEEHIPVVIPCCLSQP